MQEKKALFILYFGPDSDDEISAEDLFDRKNNCCKNDKLVEYVSILYNDMQLFHLNRQQINESITFLNECHGCFEIDEDYNEKRKKFICEIDEYGTLCDEEMCARRREHVKNKHDDYLYKNNSIIRRLNDLSEIMRIYAKIEWSRAKKGK